MKILSQLTLLLMFILVTTSSCRKDKYNQPNAECVLTHSDDDLFGYSFDLVYNTSGNPASMDFAGFPAIVEYDNKRRLSKAVFGDAGVRSEFVYKNNSYLPTLRLYIRPDFGGLILKDSFGFNIFGQRTIMVRNNFLNGDTFVYRYQYDNRANLKKVMLSAIVNGIESTPQLRFEGLRYDNQPNSLSGNQWLKYLFDLTEFDDYHFLQFSANNAIDWIWYYGNDFPYKVTTGLTYNPQGFAIKRSGLVFDTDGITELASLTQTNASSCDAPLRATKNSPAKNWGEQKREINHLPYANE